MNRELIEGLVRSQDIQLSNMKPSEWAEANRYLTEDETPMPGKFSFQNAPFAKEILNTLSVNHPAKKIAIMKGAQIGMSKSFIENAIGYIISEQPGNILFLTGHSDLSVEAVDNLDRMIDNSGIRHLIRSTTKRAKSQKTGDTNTYKEFPGGKLWSGSAGNHKLLRQRSARYIFVDDYEAAKSSSKEAGDTQRMIEQRAAAYYSKMKIYFISSPELKEGSNIESAYLQGDQRKFHVSCPCCKEWVVLEWSPETELHKKTGITWDQDEDGNLVAGSVGYICPKCGDFFSDKNKFDLINNGKWIPTAEPAEPDFYSYQIPSLYSMAGSFNWEYYVRQWLIANPPAGQQNEEKHKAFLNLVLGQTYEAKTKDPKATKIQQNIRDYDVGEVPESMSEADGNGKIIILTCAADLNGKEDDARLDYEIVAWSESGASYSVDQGSIGTFVPRENSIKHKVERERWSYKHGVSNSVWTEFEKVISQIYETDTGVKKKIAVTVLDCGYFTQLAYEFLDLQKNTSNNVIGARGNPREKWFVDGMDRRKFQPGKERNDYYVLETNKYKDQLADYMELDWDWRSEDTQPPNFMNFPTPRDGKYTYRDYFSHFESEKRQVKTEKSGTIKYKWDKVNSVAQNHFWDDRVYNIFARDQFCYEVSREMKVKTMSWAEVVEMIKKAAGK